MIQVAPYFKFLIAFSYLKSSIRIWNRNGFSNTFSVPKLRHWTDLSAVSVLPYSLVKSVVFPDRASRNTAKETAARSHCNAMANWARPMASLTWNTSKIMIGNTFEPNAIRSPRQLFVDKKWFAKFRYVYQICFMHDLLFLFHHVIKRVSVLGKQDNYWNKWQNQRLNRKYPLSFGWCWTKCTKSICNHMSLTCCCVPRASSFTYWIVCKKAVHDGQLSYAHNRCVSILWYQGSLVD